MAMKLRVRIAMETVSGDTVFLVTSLLRFGMAFDPELELPGHDMIIGTQNAIARHVRPGRELLNGHNDLLQRLGAMPAGPMRSRGERSPELSETGLQIGSTIPLGSLADIRIVTGPP